MPLLTKSRFKLGCECPRKLYYSADPTYANTARTDTFLHALADGGFQVSEFAKLQFPGGIEITAPDQDEAVKETNRHLSHATVTLFEAAVRHGDLFVRIDILQKTGNLLEIIEVKAKSHAHDDTFLTRKKKPHSDWKPHLLDIAFQTYVVRQAFPGYEVRSYLMLADKTARATVDGVNQHFLIRKNKGGRHSVICRPGTTRESLGRSLLTIQPVDEAVEVIFADSYEGYGGWDDMVLRMAEIVTNGIKVRPKLTKQCKACEFRAALGEISPSHKSGFHECWQEAAVSFDDPSRQLVIELWNRSVDDLLEKGRRYLDEVDLEEICPKDSTTKATESKPGLTAHARREVQINKAKDRDPSVYWDRKGLRRELEGFTYPLHFIDFETMTVALPFHKGRRPYEQIAFQFSHHVVDESWRVTHQTQWICRERGAFPNFEFLRELKKAIGGDSGTIFRYAAHENSVLKQIVKQLEDAVDRESDADELIEWVRTITVWQNEEEKIVPPRAMVDMHDLVKRYYYHPRTRGSNSIKKVFPAVLGESDYLRAKYSRPIYGGKSPNGSAEWIPSLNWEEPIAWVQVDADGTVVDPYKRLPPVGGESDTASAEALFSGEDIADGGSAMTAYARMQFEEMSEIEREELLGALLKYCELDTLAMVMLWEYWREGCFGKCH